MPAMTTRDDRALGRPPGPEPVEVVRGVTSTPHRVQFAPSTGSWAVLVAVGIGVTLTARSFPPALDALGIVASAFWLALLTHPFVARLTRHVPRGVAAALVALGCVVVIAGSEAMLFRDVRAQAQAVQDTLQSAVAALDGETARLAEAAEVSTVIDRLSSELPVRVVGGDGRVASVLPLIGRLVAISVLAAFVQVGARPISTWMLRRWPARQEQAARDVLAAIDRRGVGQVRAALCISVLVALAVGVSAQSFHLPGPVALGVWAALWSWLSPAGHVVGLAPLAVVGWTAGGSTRPTVAALVIAIAVSATLLRHRSDARTVRLGTAIPAVALLLGFLVGGVVGASVAWGVAAMGTIMLVERPWGRIDSPVRLADRWIATSRRSQDPSSAADAATAAQTSGAEAPVPGERRLTTVSGRSAVVGGLVLLVGLGLLWLAAAVVVGLVLLAIGLLLALALDRPVSALQRRIGRPAAIGAVGLAIGSIVIALGIVGTRADLDVVRSLRTDAPAAAADAEELPVIGPLVRRADLETRVRNVVTELPQDLARQPTVSRALARTGVGFGALLWSTLFIVGCLVDGPRIVDRALRLLPDADRPRATRLGRASRDAVAGYAAGSTLVALLNATMVLTVALAVGLPLAPVLALWAFFANFVPQLGGLLGGAPLVVLAATQGPVQALVAVTVFVLYQNLENHVLQPAIVSHAIDAPPWLTLVAALVGAGIAGVPGAVLATPLVGLGRAAVVTRLGRVPPPPDPKRRKRPGPLRRLLSRWRTRSN